MVKPEALNFLHTQTKQRIDIMEVQIKLEKRNLKWLELQCKKHPIQKPKTDTVELSPKDKQLKGAS